MIRPRLLTVHQLPQPLLITDFELDETYYIDEIHLGRREITLREGPPPGYRLVKTKERVDG